MFEGVKVGGDQAMKKGESCGDVIIGIPLGRATVLEAARRAEIKEIHSISYSYFSVFGFYARYCLIVNGQ
jgi:hypothetical protein